MGFASYSATLGSSIIIGDGSPEERNPSSEFASGTDSAGEATLDMIGEVIVVAELARESSSSGPFVILRGNGARVEGLRVCFDAIAKNHGAQRRTDQQVLSSPFWKDLRGPAAS